MTLVAVLDYGIGNLRSAQKALQHIGADARLTADPGLVRDAAGVVLPGVGAFGSCMAALRASKLDEVALAAVERGTPFLGICIGMQLLFEGSEESPGVEGLRVLPGMIRLLPDGVKRPQMQWNLLERQGEARLLATAPDPAWAYFVHSYAADTEASIVSATCDYGGPVVAAVESGNVWATQFHPEKSARTGLAVLAAFVARAASTGGP
jgi:glutamine amidotransferase